MATEQTPGLTPQSPWYKARSSKIFFGVLGILFLAIFTFLILSGFYFLQIKSGKGANLNKHFEAGLSLANKTTPSRPTIEENIRNYIRGDNPKLGRDDAPITILFFIDFECPFSQATYRDFKSVIEKYEGVVQVVFKHFPITYIHQSSQNAALAATCAQEQKAFWPYYDQLFQNKRLSKENLISYAKNLNLNTNSFETCLKQAKYQNTIDTDLKDVQSLGVRGTPTYFVNQQKLEGVIDLGTWDKIILQELTKNK